MAQSGELTVDKGIGPAKALLKAIRAGDAEALARCGATNPQLKVQAVDEADPARVRAILSVYPHLARARIWFDEPSCTASTPTGIARTKRRTPISRSLGPARR